MAFTVLLLKPGDALPFQTDSGEFICNFSIVFHYIILS